MAAWGWFHSDSSSGRSLGSVSRAGCSSCFCVVEQLMAKRRKTAKNRNDAFLKFFIESSFILNLVTGYQSAVRTV
jgi:hypothetical protein